MKTNRDDLFSGLAAAACAGCDRIEPREPMHGWPNMGKFISVGKAKLCLRCANELRLELDILSGEASKRGAGLPEAPTLPGSREP